VVTVCLHVRRSASPFTPVRRGRRRRRGSRLCLAITSSRRDFASFRARQLFPAAAASPIAEALAAHLCASTRGTTCRVDSCGRAAPPQPARSATRVAAAKILNTFRHVPDIRPKLASQSVPGTVKLLLMPMLHGCAFPGCSTFTLSTYCVEHELLVRALKESERANALLDGHPEDAALTADPASEAQQPAAL
jgi:hypothetical protein